ncbi:hypothetical protein NZK35_27955 [Stieleria sp. ICT_E10.1]|uniref:hypothetical protein n=1 Tax=Stieleria sedimenti TaxID=2976331 RepID=UPI00217F6C2C|nr:hypothetical protein [Stieleria sedimenti]MCS7470504.1 hypothetical protein [Stieleria sedimenti]
METFIQENQLFVGLVLVLVVGAFFAFHLLGGTSGWSDGGNDGWDSDYGDGD